MMTSVVVLISRNKNPIQDVPCIEQHARVLGTIQSGDFCLRLFDWTHERAKSGPKEKKCPFVSPIKELETNIAQVNGTQDVPHSET